MVPDAGPQPSQSVPPIIIDRPIAFTARRKQLTIDYRRIHQNPSIQSFEIEPKMIVLHYTAGNSAENTFNYFNKTEISGARAKLAKAGRVNVSAHFLVDRDGTIFRLVPENWMARHTIGLNHLAIGIENVGNAKDFPLTPEQVAANAALIRYLVSKHPITHLIGHSESMAMKAHPYWRELDPNYRNQKADPGKEFMANVRTLVADLKLEGAPLKQQ